MRIISLTLVGALAGGCASATEAPTTEAVTVTTRSAIRHLALGDSYTVGESVRTAERWPAVLATLLSDAGVEAEVTVIARTGWTTAELDAAIDAASPSGPFDLVTLMIGVNDQFRGLAGDGFRERFAALVERSIVFAGDDPARVVVLTIPDWGVTPFAASYDAAAVAAAIDEFNAIVLAEAASRDVAVVDVTPLSRERPDLVASDGLHPSAEMHRLWAEMVLPHAVAVLAG